MNFRTVFHLISFVPLVLGTSMLVCWLVGGLMADPWAAQRAFALSAAIALFIGSVLWTMTRGPVDLNRRDGVGVVAFGWLISTLLGALPFIFSRVTPTIADAWFESVSGFTTTGASVLSDLENAPRGILLWRAMTQFVGGMGILVLCVAILPLLGSGGMQIYRAEAAGPSKDRLTPRIANTAKLLWGVYAGLTLLQIIALKLLGMSWFDAICHAITTTATGGFSTRTASIAAFGNPAIEWTIIFFMFLAGMNFALHWRLLRGEGRSCLRDAEWRLYALIVLAAILAVGINTNASAHPDAGAAWRGVVFTVVSLITTTGFSTDDYTAWPALSQYILFGLFFIGGCAGSTAGGIKIIRMLVLLKQVVRELKLFIQPQAIYHVKIGRQVVDPEIVSMIGAFFIIFIMLFVSASILMMLFIPDSISALSAVASALGNVGPGMGAVGPSGTYAFIPSPGKVILACCMLLGRLELYTLLVILVPGFWRR